MNGWERIAVVIACIAGVIAFIVGYDSSRIYHSIDIERPLSYGAEQTEVDAFWRAFWARDGLRYNKNLKDCVDGTVRGELGGYPKYTYVSVTCDKSDWGRIEQGLSYAFWPLFVMWVLSLIIRWIYQGFRPPKEI